jgi:hypothetical protein
MIFIVLIDAIPSIITVNTPFTLGDHFFFLVRLTNCDLNVYSHIPYKALQDSDCRQKKT